MWHVLVNADQFVIKSFQPGLNLSKLVQPCSNLSKLVQSCPNLSKVVQTCSNLSKCFQTVTILTKCDNFDQLWQFRPFVTIVTIVIVTSVILLTKCENFYNCENFNLLWQYWPIVPISDQLQKLCSIVTILTSYENDDQLWQFKKVLTNATNCDKQ